MKYVIACIADTPRAEDVCDHAIWAAQRLDTDLEFLHVLEHQPDAAPITDLSGGIWMGAQETLLLELAELDKRRFELARTQGQQRLQSAVERARAQGALRTDGKQRQGLLVDTLLEIEADTRLFVMGPHSGPPRSSRLLPDHKLEASVRALRRPILVANQPFRAPARFMLAFDGSETSRHTVEAVSRSPLLTGLACQIVVVQSDGKDGSDALQWARSTLVQAGFAAEGVLLDGEPAPQLLRHATEQAMDLLVMGAYGHSRIRQLVLGSTTTALLNQAAVNLLILR
ncbi:MAG: universal stress protein [Bordetella sp.]|nr:universal stress protein [Bordetella sp.]